MHVFVRKCHVEFAAENILGTAFQQLKEKVLTCLFQVNDTFYAMFASYRKKCLV